MFLHHSLPLLSTISLSIPLGPRVVLTASAITLKRKHQHTYLHICSTQLKIMIKRKKKKVVFSDLTGIDVTNELGYTLRWVCPLLQQDNRCGLEKEQGGCTKKTVIHRVNIHLTCSSSVLIKNAIKAVICATVRVVAYYTLWISTGHLVLTHYPDRL